MSADSFSSLCRKESCDANCFGQLRELGFNLSLVIGDLGLLRLHFFDQGEKFLVVFGDGCLCQDRSRCHRSDKREGKEEFHREKCCLTMR